MSEGNPDPEARLRVLVVGTGAVGGYYGGMLARAGHAVTFVARGEHGRAIAEHGLTLVTPAGEMLARGPVLGSVEEAPPGGTDLALVAVKAAALGAVAPGVGRALGPGGLALPLLNGLDSEADLASVIGAERVVGGVAQIAARLDGPGRVHVDAPARLVIAPLRPEGLGVVERLARSIGGAGFGVEVKKDLGRVLWTKLLWNAPFNALCALTRRTAGQVMDVPELVELAREAMNEVAAVARTEGVTIEPRTIDATLEVTRSTFGTSVPSMLQDVLAGRPTEARALQGAVVSRGDSHGIPTPVHRCLLALLIALERNPTSADGAPPNPGDRPEAG